MTSQDFFWASAVIALGLIALFLWPRRTREPSRLRLLKSGHNHRNDSKMPSTNVRRDRYGASMDRQTQQSMGETFNGNSNQVKILNVMFNYNGHSWDAHEVLGVPAGASLEAIEAAYQQSVRTSDPSSRDFLDTAYQAIQIQIGSRRAD